MEIKQIYTGCLAQGAYYIESNNEVAIIDPLREVDAYVEMAEKSNSTIKYIFETHFHADFVSGHLTLAEKTGAAIVFGPTAETKFKSKIASDGELFKLGNVTIKALHTPGHTMESTTYLLLDEEGKEHAIFTGDTLFLGDVGRPDLAQKATSLTREELAATLYDSLRQKIMPLPDDTIVYPGHGAGSACGKNMSSDTVGHLGEQKKTNYALREDMSKEEFVKELTEGLLPPPAYFPLNVVLNKEGYKNVDEVIEEGSIALNPDDFETMANESAAIMLDVRHQSDFAKAHIPTSIFIGIDGGFAPWVGALIKDVKQPILLIADQDRLKEVITRLSRVGFDHVIGYLNGGISSWLKAGKETDSVKTISAEDFATLKATKEIQTFDVRKQSEYNNEHLLRTENTPLDNINEFLEKFNTQDENYIHCAGGYRSMIANSILKSRGMHNSTDILGGFDALKKTNLETSQKEVSSAF